MSWLHYLIRGLLGVLGGALGNLVVAIIEGSLGHLTPLQVAEMIAGIIVVVTLTALVEQLPMPRLSIFGNC